MAREMALETREGRFVALRGGPAGGPLVLLLHGFPDHPPTFAPLLDRLAAAGCDVVAPWMRGYGPSVAVGPYDPMQLGRDVLAMLAALDGAGRGVVVGHDWGAVATYAACALDPSAVRAAVAMAVPHPMAFLHALATTRQFFRSWYMFAFQVPGAERVLCARDAALVDWIWRTWSPGLTLDAVARAELHECLAASVPAPVEYYRAMVRRLPQQLRSPIARQRVSVPLLQLQGEADGCISPAACRGQEAWFSGPFQAEIVPDVGHFMHVEAPAEIARRIVAWCAAHG